MNLRIMIVTNLIEIGHRIGGTRRRKDTKMFSAAAKAVHYVWGVVHIHLCIELTRHTNL